MMQHAARRSTLRPHSQHSPILVLFRGALGLQNFGFIPSEKDSQDRLKTLSLKGFFNMNANGVALNIELIHSYKGICDVLYNG